MALPAIGDVVDGKYLIEGQMGQGGMGVVFAARNMAGDFPVALKWLLPAYAQDESARARFRREAQLAAYVRSRHVIRIYDVGGEQPYFVMERLHGRSLRDLLAERGAAGVPLNDLPGLYLPVLQGVHAAHGTRTPSGQAVIHRDLKPDNIFLAESADGIVPTVLDFGIARLAEAHEPLTMNTTNMLLGTPQYMSREQFFAQDKVGPWTDIHALGVILYELVAGRRPYEQSPGQTAWDLIMKVSLGQYEPLTYVHGAFQNARLGRLDQVVAKAMAPEIADRYASVAELLADLQPLLAEPWPELRTGTGPAPVPAVPGSSGPRAMPGTPWPPVAGASQKPPPPPAVVATGGPRPPTTLSPVVTTLGGKALSPVAWPPPEPRKPRAGRGWLVMIGAAVIAGLVTMVAVRVWRPQGPALVQPPAERPPPTAASAQDPSMTVLPAGAGGTTLRLPAQPATGWEPGEEGPEPPAVAEPPVGDTDPIGDERIGDDDDQPRPRRIQKRVRRKRHRRPRRPPPRSQAPQAVAGPEPTASDATQGSAPVEAPVKPEPKAPAEPPKLDPFGKSRPLRRPWEDPFGGNRPRGY